MRAGRLSQVALFQRQSVETNDYGERLSTWADLFSRRVWLKPLRTQEAQPVSGEFPLVFVSVWLRRDVETRTLRADDRMVVGTQTYDIGPVMDVDRRTLTLQARLHAT